MHKEQHIWETSERDSKTGDSQVRREFDPATFGNVIQDSGLLRTYEAWMAGNDNDEALAAEIDVSSDIPLFYRIKQHRNAEAFGLPSEGLSFADVAGRWVMHTDKLLEEYEDAKHTGIRCDAIYQEIDGEERRYHRVIVKRGETLLVASAKFERE